MFVQFKNVINAKDFHIKFMIITKTAILQHYKGLIFCHEASHKIGPQFQMKISMTGRICTSPSQSTAGHIEENL